MKAIQVRHTGGPEVLESVDVECPVPAAKQALVRLEAVGVNFIDVYHRTGLYKLQLPFIPGSEGAGLIRRGWRKTACSSRGRASSPTRRRTTN